MIRHIIVILFALSNISTAAIITHSHCPNHSRNNSDNMHTHDTSDPDHNAKHVSGHPHTWEYDEFCPDGYERDTHRLPPKNSPTDVKTDTDIDTDSVQSEVNVSDDTVEITNTFHGGKYIPKPPTDFFITHTRIRNKPYTLYIYVKNGSGRFVSGITLEIVNPDDTVAFRGVIDRTFTPQYNKRKDYVSPDGIKANNLIAIAGSKIIKDWDYRKEPARFLVGVYRFRSKYTLDSTMRLLWDDEVISEYPNNEDTVAGAPVRIVGNVSTSWASIKERKWQK